MSEQLIFHKQLTFETKGNKATYFEIREDCNKFIEETGVKDGILVVQSPHTTCAVFFEEMVHDIDALGDEYLQHDLNKGLNKVFPKQLAYDDYYKYPGPLHRKFSYDNGGAMSQNPAGLLNGDAHLKATLLGSNKTFIIKDGKMLTGTFGYIYFVDFDGNRARNRKCNLCVLGK